MFTQHLVKNCLWLFAAVQCFSPSQLSRFLVVVMTTFMLQIGFVNGVFAEDVTTTAATDATTTTVDTAVVDEQTLLKTSQNLFSMSMQNDADGLSISITGIAPMLIDRIFFDGSDVTELVNNFVNQGIAKVTETENSYTLNVAMSPQIEGEHTLTVSTIDGSLLSRKLSLEKYDSGKYSSIGSLQGFAYIKGNSWYSMSQKLSSATIVVNYCSRGFCYSVNTSTDSSGWFNVSCDSPRYPPNKQKSPSDCYKPSTASFSYISGSSRYISNQVDLKSPALYYNKYNPVMVKY